MGEGSSIHMGCKFNCRGNMEIGKNSTINQHCHIDNRGGVFIGNNVSISPHVKIITADHDLQDELCAGRTKAIIIDDYCFIGSDAMILQGCHMKIGSVVGAKALLTSDTEENYIYTGIPAKKIKSRNPNYNYSSKYRRWFL